MTVTELDLPEVLLIALDAHVDERGWFMELWHRGRMAVPGLPTTFVQDNLALSRRGVLRGLHYQEPQPQGKLVAVTVGEIFDVAVDVRPDSATFGRWTSARLTPGQALYIPEGFAHGYQALSDTAQLLYKCTSFYQPEFERAVAWNDPTLAIPWPILPPILSVKDRAARNL